MADTTQNFIANFQVKGIQNLEQAQAKISAIDDKLKGLAATLLGVSFGAFIAGAMKSADAINDLSDATGISIASIKSFQDAMGASGGKVRNAERAILGFVQAIETANDGSLKSRDAFAKVGVSLSDLKNLSEADLLQKKIDNAQKAVDAAQKEIDAKQELIDAKFKPNILKNIFTALELRNFGYTLSELKKAFSIIQLKEVCFSAKELKTTVVPPHYSGNIGKLPSYWVDLYNYEMHQMVVSDPKRALITVCLMVFGAFFFKNLSLSSHLSFDNVAPHLLLNFFLSASDN